MKTYRVLGTLWLMFCCYGCFNEFRALLALHPTDKPGLWPAWYTLAGCCLLFLAGIAASLFLFRGARWARWIVGLVAGFVVLSSIASVASQRALPVWAIGPGLFALASLLVLFSSRHESVA
jgi:hypothetical protein